MSNYKKVMAIGAAFKLKMELDALERKYIGDHPDAVGLSDIGTDIVNGVISDCYIHNRKFYNAKPPEGNTIIPIHQNDDGDHSEGFKYKESKEALKLFMQTKLGKHYMLLFMKKGNSFGGHIAKTDGQLSDLILKLVETEIDSTDNMAFTRYSLNGDKVSEAIMAPFQTDGYSMKSKLKFAKTLNGVNVKVAFHKNMYDSKLSNEELVTSMAHTFGHEFFLHSLNAIITNYRFRGNKDYQSIIDFAARGCRGGENNEGRFDHRNFINNVKTVNTIWFSIFENELKSIVPKAIINKVINDHKKTMSKYAKQ